LLVKKFTDKNNKFIELQKEIILKLVNLGSLTIQTNRKLPTPTNHFAKKLDCFRICIYLDKNIQFV